jgi:1-acyl-sn-glycerol-3-phosphate acyltransferase
MIRFLRHLFFLMVVRPVVLVVLGLNVRHRERLPKSGPAMVIANHNSHLDTLVLMTLFPPRLLGRLRPAAAMDYFLGNRFLAWFARNIMGIIPVARRGEVGEADPLAGCHAALDEGSIVVFFPEGSRGEPEKRGRFRSGIFFLAGRHPEAAVVPVFLHGLGKALPRGEFLLVPFFVDVFVGEPLTIPRNDKDAFMAGLERGIQALAAEGQFPAWE